MANMNVTYADMTDAANRLTAGKDDITQKLQQLQSLVNNLVGGGFITDSASGAFHQSYEEFNKGTTQAVNGLDGMSQFLTKAADAYRSTDEGLAKGLS